MSGSAQLSLAFDLSNIPRLHCLKEVTVDTAIAGLAWAWARAPLRGERPKEQASMSVRKGAGARTKKARLVVVKEQESQLRLAQSRQVELDHAGCESWESFQVDSKAMPHTKPRPKLRA